MSDSGQNIDSVKFEDLDKAQKNVAQAPDYQKGMIVLRQMMKQKLLGNIWLQYQANPELKMGVLPARELFAKLEKFNLFQNDTKTLLQADPERISDFYVLNENWGIINREGIEKTNHKGLILLPMHIFLGSAGYQDENYKLSLLLALYNQSLDKAERDGFGKLDFERLFPKTEKELYRKKDKKSDGGGFTGVGGGGDDISISVKAQMINYSLAPVQHTPLLPYCATRWSDPNQFALDVLDFELESRKEIPKVIVEQSREGQYRIVVPRFKQHVELGVKLAAKLSIIHLCELLEKIR